jgi:hypothetical protein
MALPVSVELEAFNVSPDFASVLGSDDVVDGLEPEI